MPNSVLQPVRRRRHTRRRRWPVLIAVAVVIAAAAAFEASGHWALARGKPHHASPPPAQTPRQAAQKQLSSLRTAASEERAAAQAPFAPGTPLLLAAKPRFEHVFRGPISAPEAILVDADNGAVLWGRRQRQRRPIASTTKIMTAILALEHLSPTKVLTINPIVPRVALNREGLRAHEHVPVWKMMYGLLLFSGNDDALELAIGAAGSKEAFLDLMNEKAHALGLTDTHFTSPSGVVDQGNYSTAHDLAALARYAMAIPRFRAIVRTRIAHVKWAPPTFAKTYVNKNQLLGTYRGANGVKTGWTTLAGHCLVASAKRNGRSLIAVVLHSPNPYGDVRRLLNFGFANS